MKLAWELKRTEDEILAMKPDEFGRWVAFFQLTDEETAKRNKPQTRTRRRSKGQ